MFEKAEQSLSEGKHHLGERNRRGCVLTSIFEQVTENMYYEIKNEKITNELI